MTRPLVVVEGSTEELARAVLELSNAGWHVLEGFETGPAGGRGIGVARQVRVGTVRTAADAAAALLAVLDGAGVVIHADAPPGILDRLLDDLRHIGAVDVRRAPRAAGPAISQDALQLLALLADGRTLGDAAGSLGLSRRTADRRLAEAREALGVGRTVEAVSHARRVGWIG